MDGVPIVGQGWAKERVDMIRDYLEELCDLLAHHKQAMLYVQHKLQNHIDEANAAAERDGAGSVNMLFIELLNNQNATHAGAISQVTGQLALLACMGVDDMPKVERPEAEPKKDEETRH